MSALNDHRLLPARYWHALPLHYAPHLLLSGELLASARFAARGVPLQARRTVASRDRKLNLSRYVHFSFAPATPLLADKLQKGYRHALISFDAAIADLPNAAFLRFNPKSWRHRDDFLPVTSPADKARFLEEWQNGAYPSAELLIENALPLLPYGCALHLRTDDERLWLADLLQSLDLPATLPHFAEPELFPDAPGAAQTDFAPFVAYADACKTTKVLLAPPGLPFD